jgi:hypothetical protein
MKKMLNVLCAVAIVAMSSAALAAGPPAPGAGDNSPGSGVWQSVHDLTNGPVGGGAPHAPAVPNFIPDLQMRLCAYCHTPHHAILVGSPEGGMADYLPLWSHEVSTVTFTPYQSATFDPKGGVTMNSGPSGDPLTGPSRLCMSCHDGLTAVDNYYGMNNGHPMFGGEPIFTLNPVIEHNGNQTHPIGFAMTDVLPGSGSGREDNYNLLALNASSKFVTGLTDNVNVLDRLYFGAIMTCATCHDVHNTLNKVSYQPGVANFLTLGTQKNSGICLSCHTQGGGDQGLTHTSVPPAAFTY